MKYNLKDNAVWVIFAIIGTFFFIVGLFVCSSMFNTENKIYTTAIITDIVSYTDSNGDTSYDVFVEYEVDGKKYESELNMYSITFSEGKEIEIFYDKDNPNKIGSNSSNIMMLMFPLFGLIFMIIGIAGIYVRSRRKKLINYLKENGELIHATYTETVRNYSYSVNGRNPYNIICEWENPEDGKMYSFKSDNIWKNPTNVIEKKEIKTIPVYIDLNDMKKNYVDVSEIIEDTIAMY